MNFARSLLTLSSLTIVSRIAGFIRDTLLASFLGAGIVADAFFVAQRLPNLFRSLFAEGAFSAAFVPLYSTELKKGGAEEAQKFAGQALALLLAVLLPFSILMMLAMPWVMRVLAPGFEVGSDRYNLAVQLSTITFPYLALISITALQTGVLNARGKFAAGAIAPIALNLVMIAGLFAIQFFSLDIGVSLAWTIIIGGIAQSVLLFISCHRAKAAIPFVRPRLTESSRALFKRLAPGIVGASASQINLAVSTMLASLLPAGAVSYLFYADRLNQLPLGIVGIAVSTALLPLLTQHINAGTHDKALHFTSRSLEFCLILGLPAAAGLALAAQPILQTLFERGAFTAHDTANTATALAAYALGTPAFLLVKVLAAGFFARHDTATPVKIGMIAMATNIFASLVMLYPLQHTGIALANSIATWTNAILLFYVTIKRGIPLIDDGLRRRFPRLILCCLLMTGVIAVTVQATAPLMQGHGLGGEILALLVIIGGSSLVYGGLLHGLRVMQVQDVLAILRRKSVD